MKKSVFILAVILFVISNGKSQAISCSSTGIDENSNTCDSCGENCSWSFDNGVLKVKGDIQPYLDGGYTPWKKAGLGGQIITIDASQVTSFNTSSFEDLVYAKTVIMPQNVTTIPPELFRNCNSIETLEIPDAVTSIELSALSRMFGLKSLIMPDSVTDIDSTAFDETENLTIYCTGNVDACKTNLGDALASKVQAASTKEINGVRYIYDKNGKLITTSGQRIEKRIYTLDEANRVAGTKNRVSITYR